MAIDSSDATGYTAYVTVMGFTGGTGHVWKTTNAGTSWKDFTANLPDAPVNAVVVDPASAEVYVATDVGVFLSSTAAAGWTELGPVPAAGQSGFLPNVAVTALALFNSGGQNLLRASTYGRGIWQFNLVAPPDYQLSISNSPQTVIFGQTATFNGTAAALNGYANSVALSCVAGVTAPPATCTIAPPDRHSCGRHAVHTYGWWKGRRLLFQCAGFGFRLQSDDAPNQCGSPYSQQ